MPLEKSENGSELFREQPGKQIKESDHRRQDEKDGQEQGGDKSEQALWDI